MPTLGLRRRARDACLPPPRRVTSVTMTDQSSLAPSGSRLTATYGLRGSEAEARATARLIAINQTVEASEEALPGAIREQLLGRLDGFEKAASGGYAATLSYPAELLSEGMAPLLNLLFGISSLRPGIRLLRFDPPPAASFGRPGPRFGQAGLRELAGVADRPLVCGVLKPVGLSAAALADLAYRFALGGLDLIKDDQALSDQAWAPFEDRVARCAEAVARANRETGGRSLYFPHVTGPGDLLRRRAARAKAVGAGGLMMAPGLSGFDALRDLAQDEAVSLPLLCHPALLGGWAMAADSGMAPAVLFGQLPRWAGADASLYPIYDAGFLLSREDCRDVVRAATQPWAACRPIFPTAAGRMGRARLHEMLDFHGPDFLFVLGSSIQAESAGLTAACRAFMSELCRAVT